MVRLALSLGFVVGSFACASPETKPAAATATAEHEGAAHHPGHHEAKDKAVTAFHDVLSPLWHATPGPERTTNTCNAAAQLNELATALTASTPATAKAGYAAQATALAAATAELTKVCATPERAAFEATFHAVHEAFHGVAEACGD